MALKVAGYDFNKLFAKNNRVIGFDKQITTNDFRELQGKEVVLQCVNSILSTPRRMRLRDVTFGCDLYKYVFDPADEETAELIRQEIYDALQEQDERISVRNVLVQFFDNNKGFAVKVNLVLPSGEAYDHQVVITPETFSILGDEDESL